MLECLRNTKEGRREGGREGGREGAREGGREGVREGGEKGRGGRKGRKGREGRVPISSYTVRLKRTDRQPGFTEITYTVSKFY